MIITWVFLTGLAIGLFLEQIITLIYDLCTRKSREQEVKAENNRKTAEFFANFEIK